MTTYTKCDKCGKTIEGERGQAALSGMYDIQGNKNNVYDLCGECFAEVKKVLGAKPWVEPAPEEAKE